MKTKSSRLLRSKENVCLYGILANGRKAKFRENP